MSLNTFYNTEITLHKAELFLDEHTKLSKAIQKSPKSGNGVDDPKGVIEFINNQHNSFIFSKESILSLFDQGADCILVALGAHNKQEKLPNGSSYNKGSFTVMTIGYRKDPNELNKLIPIESDYPAYEYPPKYIAENLDQIDYNRVEKKDIIEIEKASLILTIH